MLVFYQYNMNRWPCFTLVMVKIIIIYYILTLVFQRELLQYLIYATYD